MEHTRTDLDPLAKVAGENFPVASRLLPRQVREDLLAVYGYARLVDDLGDEAHGDRTELLENARDELGRIYTGAPVSPVFRRLQPVVHAHDIPRDPFDRLIDANLVDQCITRYRTLADLMRYCELSANPVGRVVLHLCGSHTPDRVALSDQVCTALQILEHVQDVAEDFHIGRVYLPQEHMAWFDVTEDDLAAAHVTPGLRALLARLVDETTSMLNRGVPLVGSLKGWAKIAVAGYVAGGRATAVALRKAHFDVLARPVKPRRSTTAVELIALLAAGR